MLGVGLRYPLTNQNPLKTVFLGGSLLLPFVIAIYLLISPVSHTGMLEQRVGSAVVMVPALALFLLAGLSLPAIGYLVYVVQRSATGDDVLGDFPDRQNRAEWKKLWIVGSKGAVIAVFCLLAPFAFLSNTIGGVMSSAISHLLSLTFSQSYVYALGAVILLSVYPAIIGGFVKHGRVSKGLNATERPVLMSRKYLRGVVVLITLLAFMLVSIQVTVDLFGVSALAVIGPIAFYFLLAIHHVIGLIWREPTDEGATEHERPAVPILTPDEPQTDPVADVFGGDPTTNLHEVAVWEARTRFDRFVLRTYEGVRKQSLLLVSAYLVVALLIMLAGWYQSAIVYGFDRMFFVSILPAALLTGYIWYRYATPGSSFKSILITFILGAAFSAGVSEIISIDAPLGALANSGVVGTFLYTFLFLSPAHLLASMAAVAIYAYRSHDMSAVIDGAVYGAIAGLGVVAMTNFTWYIGDSLPQSDFAFRLVLAICVVGIASFGGYYLGLAKFNPEYQGPIAIKGFVLIVLLIGSYEFSVRVLNYLTVGAMYPDPEVAGSMTPQTILTTAFAVALLVMLYRKLSVYSAAYAKATDQRQTAETTTGDGIVVDRIHDYLEELVALHERGVISDTELYELSNRR
ncbi:hypothetical protein [Natronorubrum sp. DTA28]|uniref:hypothetical protein n=1 Tax=Natronorubrum sp. DTA28 TaxID=3447019 RepID=UPI003F841589